MLVVEMSNKVEFLNHEVTQDSCFQAEIARQKYSSRFFDITLRVAGYASTSWISYYDFIVKLLCKELH
jgi:hypothetical protein